jgi:hypothetical protein
MTDNPTPALLPVPVPSEPVPRPRATLMPERSDCLDGDEPAAAKVESFLAKALDTIASNPLGTAHALVPLLSTHVNELFQELSWFGACREAVVSYCRGESTPPEPAVHRPSAVAAPPTWPTGPTGPPARPAP